MWTSNIDQVIARLERIYRENPTFQNKASLELARKLRASQWGK